MKTIYRLFYDSYFKWADVTWIGMINRKLEQAISREERKFDSLNLQNVFNYIKKNRKLDGELEKNILVESMHYHAITVFHISSILSLLICSNNSRVVGFSNFREKRIENINKSFGIDCFVTIYNIFSPKVVFLSLLSSIKSFYNGEFTKFDNLKVIVDGVNIGDHVYDSFLRIEACSSFNKKTIKYFLYIYRGCYYFYRSRQILKEQNITDIVVSHIVYTGAILIKAASIEKNEITVWSTDVGAGNKLSLSKRLASECKNEVIDNRIFKYKYIENIVENYTSKQLLQVFNELFYNSSDLPLWLVEEGEKIRLTTKEFCSYYGVEEFNKKNIFLLTHAFNDAVRHCNNSIFKDYRIWLEETLLLLSKNDNINIFVKKHPKEDKFPYLEKTKFVVDEIKRITSSKSIFIVEHDISKKMLYSLADVVITVCGSAGMELPCIGMPVVTAARGTYYNANTTLNSENICEYEDIVRNIHNVKGLTPEKTFSAKLVYIFALLLRYVNLDINLSRDNNNVKYSANDDVGAFNKINEYYHDLDNIENTELYINYKFMLENEFDEFINIKAFRRVLDEINKNNERNKHC